MKRKDSIKFAALAATIAAAGCAGGGGGDVISRVDSGLASVERTAQTGRQVVQAGTAAATSVPGSATGLTNALVSQLGVSPQQAMGGAGAIFQAAKANMAPQAFSNLAQSLPGMNDMLAAAPQVSPSLSGVAGGVTSAMGRAGGTAGTVASLASSFQQLNMSPTMVNQFIPVVVDYVKTTSGEMTGNLLQSALTAP